MVYAGDASVIDALPNKSDVLKNGYNDSSTDYTQIGISVYNSRYDNNAYVGYMYGENYWGEPETSETTSSLSLNNYYYYADSYTFDKTSGRFSLTGATQSIYDGSQVGKYTCSSTSTSCTTLYYIESENTVTTANAYIISRTWDDITYEETHANITNSTIKGRVDSWYETNLLGTEYEQYIADTLFCNDRSFGSSNSGTGIGASVTYYRWYYGPWSSSSSRQYPRLTCAEQNDRFTVNDELIGNGDLSYPIGLVTTDEVVLAGGYSDSNSGYYLYTGNYYWTMSPGNFRSGFAGVRGVYSDGSGDYSVGVNSLRGVRPTLNLLPDSLKVGSGTADDPWRLAD